MLRRRNLLRSLHTTALAMLIAMHHRDRRGASYSFSGFASTHSSSRATSARLAAAAAGMRRGDYYPSVGGGDDLHSFAEDDENENENESESESENDGRSRRRAAGSSGHIVSIRSSNIAGMIGDGGEDGSSSEIRVDFGSEACFVAVTGESGSGKSLLISKAIDLIVGGKAVSSLAPSSSSAEGGGPPSSVELVANLYEPHLAAVSTTLRRYGIDPTILLRRRDGEDSEVAGELRLERTLVGSGGDSGRVKSACRINGRHVSLATMREVAGPLFVRVDVGVASAALGRPASRLTMLDTGVPDGVRWDCARLRDVYVEARKRREGMEHDLASRILPSALRGGNENDRGGFDEGQMKLLRHWVDELDTFEARMAKFQQALSAQDNDLPTDEFGRKGGIFRTLRQLRKSTWGGMQRGGSEDDSLFTSLIDFREEIKAVETRMVSAHSAYETLASLTAPTSALVALENARKLLFGISSDDGGPLFEAIERTHELLNDVEASLNDCARSIDGDLISTLENMAFTGIPLEAVDGIIADWNALARKHGISPYSLPNCHMSMREELDGNVEAMKLLPEAKEEEKNARANYSHACRLLSDARNEVAMKLSRSVSNILPSLGLDGSTLQVQLSTRSGGFEDPYYGTETVGVDIAEFQLIHRKNANGSKNGGSIEQVGSSGEKSRVLLAIETALPGSIGSTCNSFSSSAGHASGQQNAKIPPIAIIYDEIDAHVGGRAAVTMAKLLADQSRVRRSSDRGSKSERGSQIIAITHSASLAAIADRHIVVERCLDSESKSVPIRTYVVDGTSRRKEIARMASGDLASGEAEKFADALIRDAMLHREMSSS
ncbi:hypothetical protein ACHAW5_006346 [Stephanodiscus triporus]|uniref:DNA repair protein RecN n=1 Tax=Stephanodiscus triporus TaxID=2934178 RepID=A0ABD3NQ92_9STRA